MIVLSHCCYDEHLREVMVITPLSDEWFGVILVSVWRSLYRSGIPSPTPTFSTSSLGVSLMSQEEWSQQHPAKECDHLLPEKMCAHLPLPPNTTPLHLLHAASSRCAELISSADDTLNCKPQSTAKTHGQMHDVSLRWCGPWAICCWQRQRDLIRVMISISVLLAVVLTARSRVLLCFQVSLCVTAHSLACQFFWHRPLIHSSIE